ncbi:sugar ABC transporter permease [Treponema phagedenis]|uniref:Sugar ABC transporter permease n=1 Tax=Treponema phagedenis TaxID=162 RepID=A0AAE6M7L3_TREPH|nr:sugar ABC transporter permease [Treponema phagedenis]EFW38276.1 ABC transporter, permease protein [Treponema phagedenis F0421]NVP23682.1 sugar ABC transporter permease [Treponema phagedenis]QEJ97559.1 sugar ABC transporter permease [Treponema phagedenis]QEK03126.1 sugar ABC transporter permease [Treponema phagedenis]QEK08752.1 sugar ABC transporter permease [Treponema phagedenis]
MKRKAYFFMMIPAFAMLIVCLYYPFLRGVVMAFQNYKMFDLTNVRFIGLKNFTDVIFDTNISFAMIVANTFIWLFGSLTFQFLLGFILALLLRKPFVGRGVYTGFVFYAWALSGFAIGLTWAWLFNGQFGLINDILMKIGIIKNPIGFLSEPNLALISVIIPNIWYGVPFFGIMLLAALQSVPKELYEAATIDGTGQVKQLFYVTIPYIKPTIVSTLLLRTMWIINFPDIIFAMTNGGPVNRTNILATQMINKVFKEYDYGQGSAIGLIIMIVLAIYSYFYLKWTTKKDDAI